MRKIKFAFSSLCLIAFAYQDDASPLNTQVLLVSFFFFLPPKYILFLHLICIKKLNGESIFNRTSKWKMEYKSQIEDAERNSPLRLLSLHLTHKTPTETFLTEIFGVKNRHRRRGLHLTFCQFCFCSLTMFLASVFTLIYRQEIKQTLL